MSLNRAKTTAQRRKYSAASIASCLFLALVVRYGRSFRIVFMLSYSIGLSNPLDLCRLGTAGGSIKGKAPFV